MSSTRSGYAAAKARSTAPELLDGERRKDLEKRKAEEAAPLTDEEEARAKENWRTLKASMPWCAEFLAALAARSDFNGRRVLANMTITPRADKGEDGTP